MLVTEFGAGQIPVVGRPPAMGRVFYVNGQTGVDTNNGIDPGTPFLTIDKALSLCEGWRNDYIIILRGGGAQDYPITVAADKQRVHIIGVTNDNVQRVPGFAAGAHAVFDILADQVEIAGLQLLTDNANPAILFSGLGWGAWIHHCSFGTTVATQDGIRCDAEGLVGGLIEHNYFGHNITRDGCRLNAPTRSVIRNNYFREIVKDGVGIHIVAGGAEVSAIVENYFYGAIAEDLVAGWAITTSGFGAIIANNHAMQTGDNTGKNPYRDLSVGVIGAKLNGWGMNYSGQAVIPPAAA